MPTRRKRADHPSRHGLKVYGWIAIRRDLKPVHDHWQPQSRDICAAHSKAECARIAGVRGPWQLWNLAETGNPEEVALAMAKPGVIFYRAAGWFKPGGWKQARSTSERF